MLQQEPRDAVLPPRLAIVISDPGPLQAFLVTVCSASILYIELHGHHLSRHGDLSLIAIRAYPHADIHVIDIQTLGRAAFTARSVFSLTLQSILENPGIRKCFWDVRDAADALWAHHSIRLQGVVDLQLFENASRLSTSCLGRSRRIQSQTYVHSLESAIRLDLQLPAAELDYIARLRRIMTARLPLTAFRLRPLDVDTVAYCTIGIRYLPQLHTLYIERIPALWLPKVKSETARRVDGAVGPAYNPQSPSKALGPWGSGQQKKAGPFFR